MGRAPGDEEEEVEGVADALSGLLFADLRCAKKPKQKFTRLDVPLWTENKARLIAAYLRDFVMITRHGAYIDGFAAPQSREHTDPDAARELCAAKLVLENQPPLLRHFWLCDADKTGTAELDKIKRESPEVKGRTIEVMHGDFNALVDRILGSGVITDSMATFCLIDQRMFECTWATLEKLATHKQNGRKIEIFYFLGSSWLERAIGGTTRNVDKIERWWGRSNWDHLLDLNRHERAEVLGRRFADELSYEHVQSWPIYKNGADGTVMYHMIHCSDHDRAPQLMHYAYIKTSRKPADEQLSLIDAFDATLPTPRAAAKG